ncbi:MAG: hypothetical protein D3904_08400 [Candidatus Electrothrix sp. EH2]|nr:hypothetical protein [Candidatus Electrothrix sp. EH2]
MRTASGGKLQADGRLIRFFSSAALDVNAGSLWKIMRKLFPFYCLLPLKKKLWYERAGISA